MLKNSFPFPYQVLWIYSSNDVGLTVSIQLIAMKQNVHNTVVTRKLKNKIKVFLLSARAHRKRVHSFMVHIEQTAWTFPPLSGKVHRITYGTAS